MLAVPNMSFCCSDAPWSSSRMAGFAPYTMYDHSNLLLHPGARTQLTGSKPAGFTGWMWDACLP